MLFVVNMKHSFGVSLIKIRSFDYLMWLATEGFKELSRRLCLEDLSNINIQYMISLTNH